jgi:hypothetical protein
MRPQLLDSFFNKADETKQEINGKWFFAKPLSFYGFYEIKKRFYHAYLILKGKATAVQYAQDYFDKKGNIE